ncbi:5-oxoprolinase subunit PxpA [Microbulbifer taiwanensis]|uniref:5-oxoprolinase subunit PxpA n=1 Tax=Microbulbifer taiwanensis TaxID=986746 RepID=A0ABW1YPJ0_9GAMM|nr:5-oxoprolinase subunit PxpA [Microbulbifer taiwanensis]
MHKIDINCDLGEGRTAIDCERDAQIMPYISRCNIACGGHAGNDITMRLSLANAQKDRLIIGAHPGYPDPENFGRRSLPMEAGQLLESIDQQVMKLQSFAADTGASLDHIKLHGALYNDAESDRDLAEQITEHIIANYSSLKIMGLANGEMEAAASKRGHPFIREGFMDRRYLNDRQLAPRTLDGSVITDLAPCLEQALCLAKGLPFVSYYGNPLQFSVDSICLHGDNPNAPAIAQQLLQHMKRHGVAVRP